MSQLDNVEQIRGLDPDNMYNRVFDFPEQLAEAVALGEKFQFDRLAFADVKNIVVIGMGGSAIGGDLARSLLGKTLVAPFQVCRNYELPEYVDDESLVIASSYSGNTEETLAALEDAIGRKSMIMAMTTGGIMEEVCGVNGIPVLKLPGGLQPRAALGYSFAPLIVFFERIGLIKGYVKQLGDTIAHLKTQRDSYIEDSPVAQNRAKNLATIIRGRMPIIYGGPSLTDVVAVRWKGQMCENAKNMAFANVYAEFNHNELVGWSDTIAPHKDNLIVIQLRDKDDHPKIVKRMDIVKGIIGKQNVPVIDVQSTGNTPLDRMFSLVQLGDFASYYLAILNNVDPTPVEAIETLKKSLAKGGRRRSAV